MNTRIPTKFINTTKKPTEKPLDCPGSTIHEPTLPKIQSFAHLENVGTAFLISASLIENLGFIMLLFSSLAPICFGIIKRGFCWGDCGPPAGPFGPPIPAVLLPPDEFVRIDVGEMGDTLTGEFGGGGTRPGTT